MTQKNRPLVVRPLVVAPAPVVEENKEEKGPSLGDVFGDMFKQEEN
ncbi:hypothetical protein V6C32_01780 [Desulforamulus ruminis]